MSGSASPRRFVAPVARFVHGQCPPVERLGAGMIGTLVVENGNVIQKAR